LPSQADPDTEKGRQDRYKLVEKVVAKGSEVVAEAMLPRLFAPDLPAEAPIVEPVRQLILKTRLAGTVGALQGMAVRPDSGALLPKIDIPVLILAGDQDQIIPPDKANALAAAIKTATLAIIENAGHMPMLEQPETTTIALDSFLSEVGV